MLSCSVPSASCDSQRRHLELGNAKAAGSSEPNTVQRHLCDMWAVQEMTSTFLEPSRALPEFDSCETRAWCPWLGACPAGGCGAGGAGGAVLSFWGYAALVGLMELCFPGGAVLPWWGCAALEQPWFLNLTG